MYDLFMRWTRSLLSVFKRAALTLALLSATITSNANTQIYIRDDVLENYLSFVADRDVLTIEDFRSEFIRRDVVDMVIVQQALALGGFNTAFSYLPGRVNFRNTRLLEQGRLLLSFDSYWLSDAETMQDDIYISAAVIRQGEYHAGLFASPDHPTMFELKNINELSEYTAVSTPRWRTDWATLERLPLKALIREDEWVSQANMVSKMLVDFIMMPFNSNGEPYYQLETIKLKHIPNTALLLNDSRHFVVSKKHPEGLVAFEALNKGLAILREQGKIVSAYAQAGFLIDTNQFNVLNQSTAAVD